MNSGPWDTRDLEIVGTDATVVLLVDILVWCLIMTAVELGNAMSEAVARWRI